MKNPLVSIITPSYNGAKFLDNYFACILAQTYDNIQLVLINNGSTDNSDDIVKKYRDRLSQRGIDFKYSVIDKNEGPLKAINVALSHITGEYFSEIDVDDAMHSDYIERKVSFFQKHSDTDILITPSSLYDVNKGTYSGTIWGEPFKSKDEIIDRYLLSKDVGYMGGSYMMKTDSFFKIYPEHRIYEDNKIFGFATMLYFPLIYRGTPRYLDEVLFDYYIHGKNLHIVSEKINLEVLPVSYDNVLKQINATPGEHNMIMHKVNIYIEQELLGIAFNENNKKDFTEHRKKLKELGVRRFKDKIKAVIISNKLFYNIYKKIR